MSDIHEHVERMQAEIAKLPPEGFRRLAEWIAAEHNEQWDRQILADSDSGAFDSLLKEVEEDMASGRTRPADEL